MISYIRLVILVSENMREDAQTSGHVRLICVKQSGKKCSKL